MHGADPGWIRRSDLRLDRFLTAEQLEEAARVASRQLPDRVRSVLVTGANGFLGRFLCLEWLERMARTGGVVHALVRGQDTRRPPRAWRPPSRATRTWRHGSGPWRTRTCGCWPETWPPPGWGSSRQAWSGSPRRWT